MEFLLIAALGWMIMNFWGDAMIRHRPSDDLEQDQQKNRFQSPFKSQSESDE